MNHTNQSRAVAAAAAADAAVATPTGDALDAVAEVADTGLLPPAENASTWLLQERALPAPAVILGDFLDRGTKCMLTGPSKFRKSFFVLELAVRVALGSRDFLGLTISRKMRVLYLNPEIPAYHMQRRLRRTFEAVLGEPADPVTFLGDRLAIVNCRGCGNYESLASGAITRAARKHAADLVVIDPTYKFLAEGTEDSRDFREFLQSLDRLAEEVGTAVLYVHHCAKGVSGDRQTIDRGAGSGWLARDFDAGLFLDAHANDSEAAVLSFICRNYPPRAPATIRFDDGTGLFVHMPDIEPIVRTSTGGHGGRVARKAPAVGDDAILALVAEGPLPATEFRRRAEALGNQKDMRAGLDVLLASGRLVKTPRAGRNGVQLIGTPKQFDGLEMSIGRDGTTNRQNQR